MAVTYGKTRGATRLLIARLLEGSRAFPKAGQLATGGSTTTLVDSKYALGIYPENHFSNAELTNQTKGFTTDVTLFANASGTFTFPTTTASAASDVYELHFRDGWTTGQYNDAIDMAVVASGHAHALEDKVDQTLVFERNRTLYPIPTGFSYLHAVEADLRTNYLARNPPSYFDSYLGLGDVAARTKLAQSFRFDWANPTMVLGDLFLQAARVGAPSSAVTVTIEADLLGSPSGTALATATVTAAQVLALSLSPTFVRLVFDKRPLLMRATDYWVVVAGAYAVSATDHVAFAADVDQQYGYGSAKVNDGSAWSAGSADLIFTLRSVQPWLIRLRARTHWDVVRDASKSLYLTEAGRALLDSYDGSVIHLAGQGAPSLPSVDTDELEVPFDFVVAHAALYLVGQNPGYYAENSRGGDQQLKMWAGTVDELKRSMRSPVRPGAVQVGAL